MFISHWFRRNAQNNLHRILCAGDRLREQGRWNSAAEKYRQALRINPSLIPAKLNLASCLARSGNIAESRLVYKDILGHTSGDVDGLELGRLIRVQGDPWSIFIATKASYDFHHLEETAEILAALIGTTSSFQDVLVSMDAEFDGEFYLAQNPDVRQAGVRPDVHYLLYGWKENRNPSPFFDAPFYQNRHRDLTNAEFPLAHHFCNRQGGAARANPVSGKYWFIPTAPETEAWGDVSPAMRDASTRAVVILPVFKGYEETLSSIYHALRARQGEDYSLLVVNDGSPDGKLSAALADLSKMGLFDYHHSRSNRGFVQTVNHAIRELSADLDVVLLNSDAYVFPGWFGRLIAHADNDPAVATITPLSNNATLCSYPLLDRNNFLSLECSPSELDRIAASINRGIAVEAPTGVGFCFFMRRSIISQIGLLDARAFKVGYGEENDFCMRALNNGYKNLLACDVFVFHVGSVSFSGIKDENYKKGQAALTIKHPNYLDLVRGHMAADSTLFARRRLDGARLVQKLKGCVVMVTHSWAGGIETYLDQKRAELRREGARCLTVRVHDLHRLSIEVSDEDELYLPNLSSLDLRTEWVFVTSLLEQLEPSLFHVNSFAGLDWHWHRKLLELFRAADAPYSYICHDYSAISHHYQLLRPDNAYAGVPTFEQRCQWANMSDRSGSADVCDPGERILAYKDFLEQASCVEVPSEAARTILADEFPGVDFRVSPHADHLPDVPVAQRRKRDGKLRIAIVGAIGPHKGSDIVAALAADSKNRNLDIEYLLVGYSNKDDALLKAGVRISGLYRSEQEAVRQLVKHQPDFVLIPSIWPETYCYALSLALKMKIPPIVFDLGAQAERVSKINWGARMPVGLMSNTIDLSNEILNLNVQEFWQNRTA